MMILSKILSEFDNINAIISSFNNSKTSLTSKYLVTNYKALTEQISRLNSMRENAVKTHNDVDVIMFDEGMKANQEMLAMFQQLTQLSSKIIQLLLSQQIILTKNNLDNEFRLVTISDSATNDEYLNAVATIVSSLEDSSEDTISLFVQNTKYLINENENLKKVA
jgi:hypothetical protein